MVEFCLSLEGNPDTPLYRRLCDALRNAILCGRLKPGQIMPSTRQLAETLAISRVTAIRAYEELLSQGYLETTMGTGTYVSRTVPAHPSEFANRVLSESQQPLRLSSYGRRLLEDNEQEYTSTIFPELNYGAAPPDCLPIKEWRNLLLKHSRLTNATKIDYATEAFGYPPLREAICGLLNRRRGVMCDPEQIALFGGAQHALNSIARVLIDPESAVAIENSGYSDARSAFLSQKARLHPIAVDRSGMVVEQLKKIEEELRLVFVTPSHHNPSGVALSPARREELLDWAHHTGTIIVEDDYESEYRYTGPPTHALHAMDKKDSVIYCSSFWKLLYPLSTLYLLIIPRRLLPVFNRAKLLSQRTFSMIEQYVLTDFIIEGHLERHIRKTRPIYARRRQLLVHALTRHFGKQLSLSKESAGMHLLVRFNDSVSDDEILRCAREAGVPMASTQSFYIDQESAGEFLVGFAQSEDETIDDSVQRFSKLLAAVNVRTG